MVENADLPLDFYRIDDLLTERELQVRDRVRSFCDKQVLPIINDYWERVDFPFELVPKLAELGVAGGTIEGYGCPGLSEVATGLVAQELARADGSVCTFFGVHSGLAMQSIALLGSEEQKQRWLPAMARLDKIGAFALTEPQHGSDAVALETRARRDGDQYVLDGAKRWARSNGFSATAKVLAATRYGVAWEAVGHAMAAFESALAYAGQREQFGTPIAGFQLVQSKLAKMLAEVTAMQLLTLRLSQLAKSGQMTDGMASLAKMHNAATARRVVADARDVLGGNGILLENHVARHQADMEAVFTYEGTDSIQSLIVGREITGLSAFTKG